LRREEDPGDPSFPFSRAKDEPTSGRIYVLSKRRDLRVFRAANLHVIPSPEQSGEARVAGAGASSHPRRSLCTDDLLIEACCWGALGEPLSLTPKVGHCRLETQPLLFLF